MAAPVVVGEGVVPAAAQPAAPSPHQHPRESDPGSPGVCARHQRVSIAPSLQRRRLRLSAGRESESLPKKRRSAGCELRRRRQGARRKRSG